jgi:hypothetical protein
VQGVRWLEHFASRTGEDAEKDQAAVEKEAEAESGMSVAMKASPRGHRSDCYDNVTDPLAWNP